MTVWRRANPQVYGVACRWTGWCWLSSRAALLRSQGLLPGHLATSAPSMRALVTHWDTNVANAGTLLALLSLALLGIAFQQSTAAPEHALRAWSAADEAAN